MVDGLTTAFFTGPEIDSKKPNKNGSETRGERIDLFTMEVESKNTSFLAAFVLPQSTTQRHRLVERPEDVLLAIIE